MVGANVKFTGSYSVLTMQRDGPNVKIKYYWSRRATPKLYKLTHVVPGKRLRLSRSNISHFHECLHPTRTCRNVLARIPASDSIPANLQLAKPPRKVNRTMPVSWLNRNSSRWRELQWARPRPGNLIHVGGERVFQRLVGVHVA